MQKLLLCFVICIVLVAASPSAAEAQAPPIWLPIAQGLAAELLKGITSAMVGKSTAEVVVSAQTRGPHLAQDYVFNDDSDECWPCWAEWDLDANTGLLTAPNHGAGPHVAWAELHWHWSDGGWRPNPVAGNGDAWWPGAYPRPDGAPDPGSDNVTAAAAVGAFHSNISGETIEFEKVGGEIRQVPKSEIVSGEAQGSLYFSPERFSFEPVGSERVRVSPMNGPLFVDLFHTSAMLAPDPALVFEPFAGLSEQIAGLTGDIAQRMAEAPGGLAVYDPNPATKVDLTVAGGALQLGTGEYDRYFDFPPFDEKGPLDLLREYFSDPSAVQIVAPTHAQEGYVPQVVFREVAFGDNPISAPGISDELRDTIPPAQYGGVGKDGVERSMEDLIGIVVAAQGTLEDAVDLAANTSGTEIADIVDNLEPGEEFTLDMTFSQSGSGVVENYATATVGPPEAPHYKAYELPGSSPGVSVDLETQFGLEEDVPVGPATHLMLPALKNGEGDLSAPHLRCYEISGPAPNVAVVLTTQFGVEDKVIVGEPKELCVPALKKVVQPPEPPPSGPLPTGPNYKCYAIYWPSIGARVDLETQFGVEPSVSVGAAQRLCVPALKDGQGDVSAPDLKCYAIPRAQPSPARTVSLTTQFGEEPNTPVGDSIRLCVPTIKSAPIGGTSELVVGGPDSAASPAGGSGPSVPYGALAGGAAAAALAIAAGGWYVRRRSRP